MMRISCILVLVAALCLGVSNAMPGPTGYLNCTGSPYPPPTAGNTTNVTMDPCVPSPCQLKKGANATAYITFTPTVAAKTLTAVVHGKLGELPPIPFSISYPNGCDTEHSNVTCPLTVGKQYHYTATVPIPSIAPSARVIVFFELQDEAKQDVICVEFPVQILAFDAVSCKDE